MAEFEDEMTMATTRQSSPSTRRSTSTVDNPAQGSDFQGSRQDYTMFVWQKLDTIEQRFVEFSEKYGRVDSKLDEIHRRIEKSESKLADMTDTVKHARSWILGVVAVCAVLFGAYKYFEQYVHFGK